MPVKTMTRALWFLQKAGKKVGLLRCFAICLKFGETLLLVGTKRMDEWELCPKFEEPIGALPQICGKWQNDVPVRLFSSFLQKSQSSCHCFDRHQLGFTNSNFTRFLSCFDLFQGLLLAIHSAGLPAFCQNCHRSKCLRLWFCRKRLDL